MLDCRWDCGSYLGVVARLSIRPVLDGHGEMKCNSWMFTATGSPGGSATRFGAIPEIGSMKSAENTSFHDKIVEKDFSGQDFGTRFSKEKFSWKSTWKR